MNMINNAESCRKILTASKFLLVIGIVVVLTGFQQTAFAQISGGAIAAIDEPATGEQIVSSKDVKSINNPFPNRRPSGTLKSTKSSTTAKSAAAKSKSTTKSTTKTGSGFVLGDEDSFLNSEIAVRVQPIYRKSAKAAGAVGLVQVVVFIDENGDVIDARARTGNKLLWPEAEKAAWATQFNKPSVYGKPAKAKGFIVFRFGTEEEEYQQEQKERNAADSTTEKPADTNDQTDIYGDIVNGRAINLVKPAYPPEAKASKAAGTVKVAVVIDENGNVISARAVSGNQLLYESAEQAARKSKFSPTLLKGNKVKVTGTVVYNFVAQ